MCESRARIAMSSFQDAYMGDKYNYIYNVNNAFYDARKATALRNGMKEWDFEAAERRSRTSMWDNNIARRERRKVEASKKIEANKELAKKRLMETRYRNEWKRQQYIYNLEYEDKKSFKHVYVKAKRNDTVVPMY